MKAPDETGVILMFVEIDKLAVSEILKDREGVWKLVFRASSQVVRDEFTDSVQEARGFVM
jgi:hypothetical protein